MKYVLSLITFGTFGTLGLGACSTPVPQLIIGLSDSSAQTCPSTQCQQVSLLCPAVMSIKILDPDHPDSPYLSQCTSVAIDGHNDMCSLASVDLMGTPIPVKHVEVQIALYPATEIPVDPATQELLCPDKIAFSAGTGFPVEQASSTTPMPALGGVGFYDPGDTKVSVTLGCTDLDAINTSCQKDNLYQVTADVTDFQKHAAVEVGDNPQLELFVGEPTGVDDHYELPTDQLVLLPRIGPADADATSSALWGATPSIVLNQYACVEVLEPVAQATPTVTCGPISNPLSLHGAWIPRMQLAKMLNAIGAKGFPSGGLTVGMVVDPSGAPVDDATVGAKAPGAGSATVMYLSEDFEKIDSGKTSGAGIFLSTDAPFGTEFSTSRGAGAPTAIGVGGNIQDVVTVVILVIPPKNGDN